MYILYYKFTLSSVTVEESPSSFLFHFSSCIGIGNIYRHVNREGNEQTHADMRFKEYISNLWQETYTKQGFHFAKYQLTLGPF